MIATTYKTFANGKYIELPISDLSWHPNNPTMRSGESRFHCPICRKTDEKTLAVNADTGWFTCHSGKCGATGRLEGYFEATRSDHRRDNSSQGRKVVNAIRTPQTVVAEPKPNAEKRKLLNQYMQALAKPNNRGKEYLASRSISLELALKYRLGFANPGTWPGHGRDCGRIVAPMTNPQGELINLYSRAIDDNAEDRHSNLSGDKGIFNAQALNKETVYITEATFDALSLLAAGYNAAAILGTNGLLKRLHWITAETVILALDNDEAGLKQREYLAEELTKHGKRVLYLPQGAYAGEKDTSAAWAKTGKLEFTKPTATKPDTAKPPTFSRGEVRLLERLGDASEKLTDAIWGVKEVFPVARIISAT